MLVLLVMTKMVGQQLVVEVQPKQDSVLQVLEQTTNDLEVVEMEEMVYNYQSVEPQPIMVVAVVDRHSLMLLLQLQLIKHQIN
tara:strand:- start:152 stop:400 length:249 start_codon:yes stop_codon:yes gene_type:complete